MIAEIAVIVVLFASVASCFASVSETANPNPSPVVTRINAATRFVVICAGIVAFPVVFGAHKVDSAVNTRIAGPRSA
jgi:hypothetical protein